MVVYHHMHGYIKLVLKDLDSAGDKELKLGFLKNILEYKENGSSVVFDTSEPIQKVSTDKHLSITLISYLWCTGIAYHDIY